MNYLMRELRMKKVSYHFLYKSESKNALLKTNRVAAIDCLICEILKVGEGLVKKVHDFLKN